MIKAKKITGFDDYYITNVGTVYSWFDRIRKLTPHQNKDGYLTVGLYKDKKRKQCRIHRLVADAFIANPDGKAEANHKNGDKTDNRVENLEWVTRSENMKYNFTHLGCRGTWFGKYGKDHNCSKQILQIKNGIVIGSFWGAYEANRNTGINHGHIIDCCNGKRNMAGGCQWKYK